MVAQPATIPERVHEEYLMGARALSMARDPAVIPLIGTDWLGHYRSPYVTAYVNGKGPFTFLFDTGSVVTTLSQKVADAAAAEVVSDVPGHHAIVRANEIRVGDVSMRDYYAVIDNGDDVDGILGFNAFGSLFLTFDFARSTLDVSSRQLPLPGATWLPYTLVKRLPSIDLTIDGQIFPTLIDTGDDAYAWEATGKDVTGLRFAHPPVPAATVVNGDTGVTQTTVTTVDGTLGLGPFSARDPVLGINDSLPVPDIGMPVIDQFEIEFDRQAREVGFAPLFQGSAFAVPGDLTPGFSVAFLDGVCTVRHLVPGMAPAVAGLAPGDPIVAINNQPVAGLNYRYWDTLVRTRQPISIEWRSHGAVHIATFPVHELR